MVAVAAAAACPDDGGDDRAQRLSAEYWIKYEQAEEAIFKLEYLLSLPRTDRMPNVLIAGPTNNGKTAVLRRFMNRHRAVRDPAADADCVDILYIEVPPNPSERILYDEIIEAVNGLLRTWARTLESRRQALTLLKNVGVRALILDEVQHILNAKSDVRTILLDTIKYIGNQAKIPIIAAGTLEALNVFNRHPQLANRFDTLRLKKWTMNAEYLRLLAGLESVLPLKRPSNLVREELARQILSLTEGTIGEIVTLVRTAGLTALRSGRECIDETVLAKCGYTVPSTRPSL